MREVPCDRTILRFFLFFYLNLEKYLIQQDNTVFEQSAILEPKRSIKIQLFLLKFREYQSG